MLLYRIVLTNPLGYVTAYAKSNDDKSKIPAMNSETTAVEADHVHPSAQRPSMIAVGIREARPRHEAHSLERRHGVTISYQRDELFQSWGELSRPDSGPLRARRAQRRARLTRAMLRPGYETGGRIFLSFPSRRRRTSVELLGLG